VASLATAVGIAQQPFELDNSFQVQMINSTVGSVVELADGKMLASGFIQYPGDPNPLSAVTRLLPNGMRDPSLPWAPGGGPIRPWNDLWYVGGGQGVVRLQADGTWDPNFFPGFINGSEPSDLFSIGQGGDFAVRSNGGLLLAGDHPLTDMVRNFVGSYQLVWVNPSGELDTTRIHRKANGTLWSISELPDGKFMTGAGGVTIFDDRPVGGIIRTLPDGALDTTFMSPTCTWGIPYCYRAQSDGKILVGGFMQFNGADTLELVRLLSTGALDTSFNNDLQLTHVYDANGSGAHIRQITPWGADRYIITGRFTHVDGEVRGGIAMIDSAGHLLDDYLPGPNCVSPAMSVGGFPYIELGGLTHLSAGDYLIYGGYIGYHDGVTEHPMQRTISRLSGGVVGITEQEYSPIQIYPNPANTLATVELEQLPHNSQLVLRDAMGREVLRQRVAGYHNNVELQGLGAGVYLLELWEDGSRKAAQRLVVER
jgi:hypothetical protein